MRVHSTLTSQAAPSRSSARRWLLSVAAVTLLVAGSASPALAAHGGSHGGGGSHHSGGGGGSHGGHGGSGGYHGGGHTGGGTGGNHGGSGGYHGTGGYHGGYYRGGGFHGGFRGHFFYPGFTASLFFGYPFPYWYYGPWGYYSDGYPYYYDGYGYGNGNGYYRDRNDQGALDLDLSPADTQVYVNGQYMGKVDDFDGWPQYLWLDPGTYDIAFYREGYKTLERQVTIRPGQVIDWTDRMEQGPSVRPEDLGTHERRDARVEQDREMRERADRDSWRDRERRYRDNYREDRRDDRQNNRRDDYRDDRGREGDRDDARSGRLHLTVEPHDASVYLDGRFLGTADDVARMRSGLLVDPGQHTLSIVRPGRHAQEQRFDVKPGADLDLNFELKNE